ncbi:MAG: hypothetical protein HZA17_04380 [Nitrospirae bacterium]|nr:hypothetical protein [Nitrospirota bacterium]
MDGKEGIKDWVSASLNNNELLFSELDVLLRALDRFFNLENLTISSEDLTSKNFYDELITARDSILRVLGILEVVIPESRKNAYWFQKFAETKLLSTRKRDDFRENLYKQDTPEKGLYLLYDSFINLKGVISDLIRTGNISYMGFMNIGHMISKEIRENRFFNPFCKDLNPQFDYISNADISGIVRSLKQKEVKKYVSIIYIYLFRFIRFMSFIDIATSRSGSLNSSLIILILLRAEIRMFQGYIEKVMKKIRDPELEMLLKSIAYQFSMENRRVYLQELRDIHRKKASPHFRGKIENSHGILKNLTEQSIVQLTHFFKPDIKGEEIFSSFVTRFQQSLRLREDIFVLLKLIELLSGKAGSPQERLRVFESIKNYMLYFESFTFRLLRYDDYEEFVHFFSGMNAVKQDTITGAGFQKVMERVIHFKIYLETTLRHIANRAELRETELNAERVEDLLRQYI